MLYMALIFGLSSLSRPPSPATIGDKAQHALAYGGLAAVAMRATAGGRLSGVTGRAALAAWAIAAGYGATDEIHQRFVPGRSPELADAAADAFGAALVAAAGGAVAIIRRARGARAGSERP